MTNVYIRVCVCIRCLGRVDEDYRTEVSKLTSESECSQLPAQGWVLLVAGEFLFLALVRDDLGHWLMFLKAKEEKEGRRS